MCVGVAHWIVLIMLGLVVQISNSRYEVAGAGGSEIQGLPVL